MLEQKFKQLQKENKIRVLNNKNQAKIDDNLNVEIIYSCGHTEKTPFLKILEHPQDYEDLLHGDTIFQKRLTCNNHCHNKLNLLKLKPFKNEKEHQEIWNLEHGRTGTADLTIQVV